MSVNGLVKFIDLLDTMQRTRLELLGGDNEDIRLGQLLLRANDAITEPFCEITNENPENAKAAARLYRSYRGQADEGADEVQRRAKAVPKR